ncbi:MAG: Spo0E family sporulation regulatory protein-aspartic acid phosphatase [Tissierellia bacterium]|nr:Spo0E family sporulation regulatory protein-aspartic acid phosphatase [Tissierellia bacterium]
MKKREQLYKQLNSKPIDSEEILKTSQELDKLMLEYYKNKEIDYKKDNRI